MITSNITTNIRPFTVHSMSGNVTTQSQQQITSGGLDKNVETDPIFRHSPAYTITDNDIANWNAASGGIDMSSYVTHTFLSEQAYLTSETDPVFEASPAAGITAEDIENWNAGGAVDLSSYVTYEYLSAQAYLTSVTFPDYSNTYQAKGDYITPEVLAQQSYLTTETEPAFNGSPASSITDTDIANWNAAAGTIDMSAYVTKNELVTQSYITINDVVFPDYSSTYQAKGNYLTNETDPIFIASPAAGITNEDIENWNAGGGSVDLSSYVTYDYLSAQAYLTSVTFPDYSNTYQAKGNYLTSESDPVFSASPAAGITAQDIQRWDNGGGSVDLSSYVTYDYLSAQAYLTSVTFPDYSNTYQAKGNYLTTETDPVFSASPAAGITAQDIQRWDNGGGSVDLSSYVTYDYLSAQAYLTSVTFPDYSNTYQAKGDYITPTDLVNCSYAAVKLVTQAQYQDQQDDVLYVITDAEPIDVSNYVKKDELAAQSYITQTTLSSQSYITPAVLVAQSYITSVTFPDYSNTYQAKGDYITPTILDSQAYVTPATLAAQSYITTTPDYFTTYTSYAYFYSYINLKLGDIETLLSQI